MTTPVIDFVIPWVDPSDPLWRAEKDKYLNLDNNNTNTAPQASAIDASKERYRSWDNLHYWFRSIETYAPWVNKIHFITYGHLPEWLNTQHPKLHIVRHEDYIPAEYRPVFSANPIELLMYKIPGLAEHFVYFNDDVFLTAPTKPTDFFVHGLPCDSLSETETICRDGNPVWKHLCQNNSDFLNRHFDRKRSKRQHLTKWFPIRSPKDALKNILYSCKSWDRFHSLSSHHIAQPYLKSTFETVWNLEPEILSETCSHHFRSTTDVNQYVFREYQLLSWQFHVHNVYRFGHAYQAHDLDKVPSAILSKKYKMICINDGDISDFDSTLKKINAAFAAVLPNKSSYEK